MLKTLLTTNDDGSPHYLYQAEGDHEALIVTGKCVGTVTTEDGTVYDITDHVIAVHPDHHDEVFMAIGDHYAANGHPDHAEGDPFIHDRAESEAACAARREALGLTKPKKGRA